LASTQTNSDNGSSIIKHFKQKAPTYEAASKHSYWSWLRRREERAVSHLLGRVDGLRVVDLGAGAGHYSKMALTLGAAEVLSVDFVAEMLEQIQHPKIITQVGDAATVRFPWRPQAVIAAGVMEFVSDPKKVLENIREQVQAGTPLVMLVPPETGIAKIYRAYHLSHGVKVRLYSPQFLAELALKTSWKPVRQISVWPYAQIMRWEAL
jgi:2-polyprenyl-3-methyl-5-hydroxy-6-metoxy-1,4-benzoquinol methylase